ncbi:Expansin-A7 [Glycine soja]
MFIIIGKPAIVVGTFQPSQWTLSHATFYGDESASATMGGACGYGNLFINSYGKDTAALSSTLFNNVTATNLALLIGLRPLMTEAGATHLPHVHMSKPAFMKIAQWQAGIIPVMYRSVKQCLRVPWVRSGGLRFSFQGNGYWLLVYVMNVGGGGDIANMWVKGSGTEWISMSHNWGASYQAFATLGGQVTSYATKETIIAWNVAPTHWGVGITYSSNVNFN